MLKLLFLISISIWFSTFPSKIVFLERFFPHICSFRDVGPHSRFEIVCTRWHRDHLRDNDSRLSGPLLAHAGSACLRTTFYGLRFEKTVLYHLVCTQQLLTASRFPPPLIVLHQTAVLRLQTSNNRQIVTACFYVMT